MSLIKLWNGQKHGEERMNKADVLVWRDNAKNELMKIKSVESGSEYLNKIKAIETWAKAEKKDAELQNIIAEQKIRTQRILGRLIEDGQQRGEIAKRDKGGANIVRSNGVIGGDTVKTLSEIGITRNESSQFKKIADLPDEIFEKEIATAKDESRRRVELTTSRILQAVKSYEKEKYRDEKAESGKRIENIDVDFRLGDFEEVFKDIKDGSVDCIITDPPYPYEFIECWTKLSRFAKRVLKPNGFCIAYSGQFNLIEVLERMKEHLDYYWMFAMYQAGSTQIVSPTNIMCAWKPVIIFQNGKKKNTKTIRDYFISENREKNGHEWQQSLSGVSYLIEMFTNPGDLICEPFAGSGTTIKACIEMKRNIMASELDEKTYNIARCLL